MSIKLNIFQLGILQKCATIFVYLASIGLGAFILDWIDKRLFIRLAETAQQQDILSPEGLRGFTALIEARDSTAIFAIILVGLGCVLIGWLFMRWAAKRNWSWPVTLPRAVEFRSAMEQFGIVDPDERVYFVRKHKLPVFIAPKPLVGLEHENVRVQLYPYASHSSLGDKEVFELHTGKQTLCLDAVDYERLLKEHGPKTRSAYAARIAELEQNVTDLRAVNSMQSSDIDRLTAENKKLSDENTDYRNMQQTAPGRKGRAEKRENDRAPFWRIAAPLVNRLIAEAEPEAQYTRPQIQKAFLEELESFPELKPIIQELLHTDNKKEKNTPFALEGWGMEAIRSALGDFAQTEPHAPKKTKKH
jgi:uncharacterized membrane protein